jgi:SET and MYND domain-containing protein 5
LIDNVFVLFQGRGLFATKDFSAGDVIFAESPLVSAQFVWNATCRYLACNHCMRSLETAEQMCQRLSGKTSLELPHLECCNVNTDSHVTCLNCGVSVLHGHLGFE